jgi:hypothetical protein
MCPLIIRLVRVEVKGEWNGRNIPCRMVHAKMRTMNPNTIEQIFDAVKSESDADPSSEPEIEKRLSMRPATKRRMETMRS